MKINRMIRDMFSREGGLEKRLFWFVTFAILVVEFLCIIIDALNLINGKIFVLNLSGIVLTAVNGLVASTTKKYSFCYTVLCLILNLILMPVTFVYAGGFNSGMPVFLTLAIIACAVHPSSILRYITAGIALLGYTALFWLVVKNPAMVTPISVKSAQTDIVISVLIAAFAVVGLLSFIVSDMRSIYNSDVREYETRTRMRLELLEAQTENIEEAKHQRKEMRRHNLIITEFAEKGDFEGLLNYLQEKKFVDEKYNKKMIYCMNGTINSVLEIYARQAQKKRIPMDIRTDVTPEIDIPNPDLVTLVSNIVENAITGAENSGNPEKKVFVDIHTRDGKLVIICKNSCNRYLSLSDGYPGHPGIGISIVEKIVRVYGGIMNYTIENGMIQCQLIIHIGEKK